MIRVVVIVTAKPGRRDELLAAFRAILPTVRAEAGCIEYAPNVDAEGFPRQTKVGPDSFVITEAWESAEALKAHGAASHMIEYAARVKDLTASAVLHYLSPA